MLDLIWWSVLMVVGLLGLCAVAVGIIFAYDDDADDFPESPVARHDPPMPY